MTVDQWQEIKRLFSICVETPADSRNQLLEQDHIPKEIRAEVQRLLRHFEEAGDDFLGPLNTVDTSLLKQDNILADRFRIVRFLGRGGMGEVYEALDLELGEAIALKLIRLEGKSSSEYSVRFRRELQLARRVTHPNVCRLFDLNRQSFAWGDAAFLTMELVQGETLASVLKQRDAFSPEEAIPYLRQILAGLHAVHRVGIIHRDLKPANVMVVPQESGSPRIVLMDFGIARFDAEGAADMPITRSRQVVGTPGYMAPEQLAGARVSPRTDLYAFGLMMAEIVQGAGHFNDSASRSSERLPNLPPAWREVMESCLRADPARRPASAEEIVRRLEVMGAGEKSWMNRRKWLAAGAVAAVGGLAYRLSLGWRHPQFQNGSTLLVAGSRTPNEDPIGIQIRAVLRQSPRLTIWNDAKLAEAWALMGRSGEPSPTARDWREIAMRDSIRFVLFTSVIQVGDGVSLALRLEQLEGNPDTAGAHWQTSFEAIEHEQMFEALDKGCRWVRSVIGESESDISDSSAKPQAVTTPSWDALKEFSRGERLSVRDREGAILAFTSAARIDPLFTMAWTRIGDIQASLGRDNNAFSAWQRAEVAAKQRPLTRREDLRFRAMFASDCADYASAEKWFKEYHFYFPGEWYGSFYRALPLLLLGRAEEAINELERCVGSTQVSLQAWLHLAVSHMYNQNRKGAELSVTKLREAGSETRAAFAEAVIAHAAGETERSIRALDRAAEDAALLPASKAALSRAIVLADSGRIVEAAESLREYANLDDRAGERDRWAEKRIGLALLLDQQGERSRAADAIQDLRKVDLGPEQTGWAGVLFARFGNRREAGKKLASIPTNLDYPRFQIPRLHIEAELRFSSDMKDQGLRFAQQAATLEPAGFGSAYLAESLERCGEKAAALVEYQDCLHAKSLQLFLAFPQPVGSWNRAATAVRRLETQLQPK